MHRRKLPTIDVLYISDYANACLEKLNVSVLTKVVYIDFSWEFSAETYGVPALAALFTQFKKLYRWFIIIAYYIFLI